MSLEFVWRHDIQSKTVVTIYLENVKNKNESKRLSQNCQMDQFAQRNIFLDY